VKRIEEHNLPPATKINQETIELLERLSLVDFANKKGIDRLEDAIRFADQIRVIDTTDVEPMITVLEDRSVYSLRYGNNVYYQSCQHNRW
jgi:aspartyl-tRNA(Asn)/glutamyl-tRNA(Gln) amidotransferase subunit C